jgi:hypothetical protein
MHAPEGYNFWVDMYDDIYEREIGEPMKPTVTPEPTPIIKSTSQLATVPIIALTIWIAMICILASLDL